MQYPVMRTLRNQQHWPERFFRLALLAHNIFDYLFTGLLFLSPISS
jgi:hypothetical protein